MQPAASAVEPYEAKEAASGELRPTGVGPVAAAEHRAYDLLGRLRRAVLTTTGPDAAGAADAPERHVPPERQRSGVTSTDPSARTVPVPCAGEFRRIRRGRCERAAPSAAIRTTSRPDVYVRLARKLIGKQASMTETQPAAAGKKAAERDIALDAS
ncbi:hypothetical protein ACIQB4_19980 [Streptomyces griseoluteus]|uniref:hypothetical protein n=1 Tax=Streptomyces griseoluteus TaxID=29306 RepID=UPI00380B741A